MMIIPSVMTSVMNYRVWVKSPLQFGLSLGLANTSLLDRPLACCLIFYDSSQRYKRFHLLHKVIRKKHYHKYLCKIVLSELRLYFVNYYPIFTLGSRVMTVF